MKTADIVVGEHYAYSTRRRYDRLLWKQEVVVLALSPGSKAPVRISQVDGRPLDPGAHGLVAEAWVRADTIICTWAEAQQIEKARTRNDQIAEAAQDAGLAAAEKARREADERFGLEAEATVWRVTYTAPGLPATAAADLDARFYDRSAATRVLIDLRTRYVAEAEQKARDEVRDRMSEEGA